MAVAEGDEEGGPLEEQVRALTIAGEDEPAFWVIGYLRTQLVPSLGYIQHVVDGRVVDPLTVVPLSSRTHEGL